MLRKIFSSILLVIFLTNSNNLAFAAVSFGGNSSLDMKTQISNSKSRIRSMKNGIKYIRQLTNVDKFINSQTSLELLEKIKVKLETKKDLVIWKDELTYELLNYITLVVEKRIGELEDIESADIMKIIENPTLTDEEIKKVEDEIVKLQINLLDSSKSFIDTLLSDLKKSVNVEKTWNLKLTVEWSGAMIWNGKWELSITNMKSKASNFDSELEAQIDLLVEASVMGGQKLKTQFSSFVNFISKDGNMYLLLQKLKYEWLDSIDYTSILDKLKELGNDNTYIKIEDQKTAMVLNMIKNFDINSIYGEANKVLLKPMLKPYKKVWDKYLLAPTKDFCNTTKYISYKINNYWSYSCSDEEYKKMLRESVIGWDLYIIIDGNDKHLWFEVKQYWEEWFMKIYYNDKKIEKLLIKAETTAWSNKWANAELIYINWQKLDIIINAIENARLWQSTNLSFKSLLTSENKFTKIDHVWNWADWKEWFKSDFKLENKKFNGKFVDIWKNEWKFAVNISWELNNLNDLSALNLITKIDTNESDSFDLNYSLKNEVITWTISLKNNDKELFSVKSNWKYKKWYFELNNKVNIVDNYSGNVDWNLNTKFTWTLEDNTFDLYIDVDSKMWIIKINLTTDSKVQYRNDIKIEAPTKYKSINEVMWEDDSYLEAPEAPEFFE